MRWCPSPYLFNYYLYLLHPLRGIEIPVLCSYSSDFDRIRLAPLDLFPRRLDCLDFCRCPSNRYSSDVAFDCTIRFIVFRNVSPIEVITSVYRRLDRLCPVLIRVVLIFDRTRVSFDRRSRDLRLLTVISLSRFCGSIYSISIDSVFP